MTLTIALGPQYYLSLGGGIRNAGVLFGLRFHYNAAPYYFELCHLE